MEAVIFYELGLIPTEPIAIMMTCEQRPLGSPVLFLTPSRYVDFGLVQQTASVIGNVEQLITNQSFHDGIRKHMESILATLFDLSKRERD